GGVEITGAAATRRGKSEGTTGNGVAGGGVTGAETTGEGVGVVLRTTGGEGGSVGTGAAAAGSGFGAGVDTAGMGFSTGTFCATPPAPSEGCFGPKIRNNSGRQITAAR